MATLIVTSPRHFAGSLRRYHILIDGRDAAAIANGESAEIALTPGRHQIAAKFGFLSSQPVQIDANPEGVHHLRIGSILDRRGRIMFVLFFSLLAVPIPFLVFAVGRLFSDPLEASWFGVFMSPMTWLPFCLMFALMIVWRDRILCLEGIPPPDPISRLVALPEFRPPRIRVTIRGLMIAVAIVALLLGAGVEWMRFTRRGFFEAKASYHSQFEDQFRGFERDFIRMAGGSQATNPNANPFRQSAAKAAAVADYHAAMKQKYEEAAARRRISVEPDPPAPPWP